MMANAIMRFTPAAFILAALCWVVAVGLFAMFHEVLRCF